MSRIKYRPRIPPSDPTQLAEYLTEEFNIMARSITEPSVSQAEAFISATSTVNTSDKYEGKEYWDKTTQRPVWATGSGATDIWHFADGSVAYIPRGK